MQSRGFLPPRPNVSENTRYMNNVVSGARINGDINKGIQPRIFDQDRYYERSSVRNDRVETFPPRESKLNDRLVPSRTPEMEERRTKRRSYQDEYDDLRSNGWTKKNPSRNVNGAKPILRNAGGYERPYCSTLPRRSRTINFKDQAYNSLEELRGYPKSSLQDLTDFELEERIGNSSVSSFPKTRATRYWRRDEVDEKEVDRVRLRELVEMDKPRKREDLYRQRRQRDPVDPLLLEEDYLRFCRNLARMERYPQLASARCNDDGGGGVSGSVSRYEPGQVHYERECRTFGKDTVAFIYYKTCYL